MFRTIIFGNYQGHYTKRKFRCRIANMKAILFFLVLGAAVYGGYYYLQPKMAAAPEEAVAEMEGEKTIQRAVSSETIRKDDGPVYELPKPVYPESALVVYDGKSFIPKEVTIVTGGTVQFMNTSGEDMWVASNNHPSHSLYPVENRSDCKGSSFDSCKDIKKGGAWSFTFTENGAWGYHNHSSFEDTGLVRVMSKLEYEAKFY